MIDEAASRRPSLLWGSPIRIWQCLPAAELACKALASEVDAPTAYKWCLRHAIAARNEE